MKAKASATSRPHLPPLAERRISDLLLRQADERPDSVALTFPALGSTWTYEQFLDQALKLGNGLKSLGLERGDRVGIMLENRPEYVLTWFASLFMGAIDVSINHGLSGSLLRHQLSITGVKAIVCNAASSRSVREIAADLPALECVISIDPLEDDPVTVHSVDFASLLANPPMDPQ